MTRKLTALAFAVLAAATIAFSTPAPAQPAYGGWGYGNMRGPGPGYGPGMMGGWGTPDDDASYGPGYGMGPWMMGRGGPGMMYGPGPQGGYGPGMMWGWNAAPPELNLTVDQVKGNFERWMAFHANPRLKLGPVSEKDGAITVDIVTVDKGGLVQRFSVDRKTGVTRIVEG
jgi:hypothetical protein